MYECEGDIETVIAGDDGSVYVDFADGSIGDYEKAEVR